MKKRPLSMLCLLVIAVQVLLVVTGVRKGASVIYPFEENLKTDLNVKGQLYQKELHSNYQILYLKEAEIQCRNQTYSPINLLVYDETFRDISLGNQICVTGKGMPFEVPRNPGNYNQKIYYENQKIAFAVWGNKIEVVSSEVWKLRECLTEVRERWHSLLCQILGVKDGGMLSAMMLGERRELDKEWKELYQVNGIGHLLAISGLHISFIGLSFYQILRKAGLSYGMAGVLGIGVLLLYTMMAGPGVSTIRALVMFVLRIGADMAGRVYDMTNSLFVSAVIIICWRPLSVCDAGFLLSFGAVFAILFLYPFLKRLISFHGKWMDGLCASLAVSMFLFPVTLYFFFEIPLYSILLNVVVIPLMSYLLGIGFIGSLLCLIMPGVGGLVLKSSAWIFKIYESFCQMMIELPGARLVLGQPKWWQVVLCYIFLLLFLWIMGKWISYQEKNEKKIYQSGIFALLLFILCVTIPWRGEKGEVQITMLDVGQGDGIFVKGPTGMTYFIDGGSSDVKQVGKYRIESYLKSQGVGCLDYVFISHGDADHMSGIEEMLTRQQVGITIKTLVLPEQRVWDENLKKLADKALACRTKVLVIKEGEKIVEKQFSITCLLPRKNYGGEIGNASSMVLLLKYGSFDMLLMGDVEGEGEEALGKVVFSGNIDVLKVAHHGSKNSTSEKVLEHIKPKIALISAGIGNRYGHPNAETLERLKDAGVQVYNTQECGAIMIETDGEKIRVRTYLGM